MSHALQPFASELLVPAALVFVLGILALLRIAISARDESMTIDGFFVAGRNIGASLSEQTFWSSSFSLANGLAYFGFLGYFYGLSVVWLQVPWCLSLVFMGRNTRSYLIATDRFTIHGFLGKFYGDGARLIASLVTISGVLGILAYELNVSSEIVLSAVGASPDSNSFTPSVVTLSIVSAVLVAMFCEFSGYKGVAKTDKFENRMGGIALLALIVGLFYFTPSFIRESTLSAGNLLHALFDFSQWHFLTILGILFYASTMNLVDMSHWQTFSANGMVGSSDEGPLRWAIIRSAIWTFFLPGAVGAFLGFVARDFARELTGNNAIALMINTFNLQRANIDIFPINGVIVGLIIFGLFCTGFSSAKNYLIAACQALWWDIISYREIENLRDGRLTVDENRFLVQRARTSLYWLAICAVIAFIIIRALLKNDDAVFGTQFLLGGAVISLVPATMLALFGLDQSNISRPRKWYKTPGLLSIICGYIANIIVFVIGVALNAGIDTYAWGPIVSLLVSFLVIVPSIWSYFRQRVVRKGRKVGNAS